jgi:hypothetical protein
MCSTTEMSSTVNVMEILFVVSTYIKDERVGWTSTRLGPASQWIWVLDPQQRNSCAVQKWIEASEIRCVLDMSMVRPFPRTPCKKTPLLHIEVIIDTSRLGVHFLGNEWSNISHSGRKRNDSHALCIQVNP